MEQKEIQLLVIFSIVIFLSFVVTLIVFFYIFQKRKTQLLIEKTQEKERYMVELAKSQTEIQEQAFKNISWELHDNVGQLLSVARIQLNRLLVTGLDIESKDQVAEVSDLVGRSLHDIRMLSRTLNNEMLKNIDLKDAIKMELERFNRLRFLTASLDIIGEEQSIDDNDEIIIFRILQEFFSNVMRHSKATLLQVTLEYGTRKLKIIAKDNGIGFDINKANKGLGILNMRNRAELIKLEYELESKPELGTILMLKYPLCKDKE